MANLLEVIPHQRSIANGKILSDFDQGVELIARVLTILPMTKDEEVQSHSDIAFDKVNNLIFYTENPAKSLYYVKNIETGLKAQYR